MKLVKLSEKSTYTLNSKTLCMAPRKSQTHTNTLEETTFLLFYLILPEYSLHISLCSFASICFEMIYALYVGQRNSCKAVLASEETLILAKLHLVHLSMLAAQARAISCVFPSRAAQ